MVGVLDGFDQEVVCIGRVSQARECHREAALVVGVTPCVGVALDAGHLFIGEFTVATDPHGHACSPSPGDGLSHGLKLRLAQ